METNKTCLQCGKTLKGRVDKKYCDDYCRNAYNNVKNSDATNLVRNINNKLRKNRRILESMIPDGENVKKIPKATLIQKGIDFKYFTHNLSNHKQQLYFFIYEYGYLDLGDDQYLIVKNNKSE